MVLNFSLLLNPQVG